MEEDRERWRSAERDIRRLMPRAFPDLPPAVTHDLERRGCLIPQTAYDEHPHNVVSGEFARRGQTDWAVLCSINGSSTILVFWRGEARDVAEIAPGEDLGKLQGMGEGRIGYSRMIAVADRKFILDHYQAYGGVTPPEIDHLGIGDAFVEKASVVHYFHQGQWLRLTGTDSRCTVSKFRYRISESEGAEVHSALRNTTPSGKINPPDGANRACPQPLRPRESVRRFRRRCPWPPR